MARHASSSPSAASQRRTIPYGRMCSKRRIAREQYARTAAAASGSSSDEELRRSSTPRRIKLVLHRRDSQSSQ